MLVKLPVYVSEPSMWMCRQPEEKLSLDLIERLTHVSSTAVIRAVHKYFWLSVSWVHGRTVPLGPLVVVLGYAMCFGQLIVKGITSGPEQSIVRKRPYPTLFFSAMGPAPWQWVAVPSVWILEEDNAEQSPKVMMMDTQHKQETNLCHCRPLRFWHCLFTSLNW